MRPYPSASVSNPKNKAIAKANSMHTVSINNPITNRVVASLPNMNDTSAVMVTGCTQHRQ